MPNNFRKSTSINGSFKLLAVENGVFIDTETGTEIKVADIIESALGSGNVFDLKVTQKDDIDITPDGE